MKKKMDKVIEIFIKLGEQIHLRAIRDANALTMPLAIIAGFLVLINSMVLDPNGFLSGIISSDTLSLLQQIGTRITNATLGMWSIAMTIAVAYCLSRSRGYSEALIPGLVSFASFITLVPLSIDVLPSGTSEAVNVAGILTSQYTGVSGLFTGIIVALLSTELFIKITKIKRLQIRMPDMVPPMVSKSFSAMIPFMLIICLFGIIGFTLDIVFGQSLNQVIITLIQQPIKGLTTSLPGFLIAMVLFNLLFAVGIHPSAIVGAVIEPALLLAMNENMTAFAAGEEATNIICKVFQDVFGLMGGTGCTICLIIAVFIFSKREDHRAVVKLGLMPGIFNINEPIIFGFPIVMNPIMIIPFVLVTQVCYILAYFATAIGLIDKCVVQIPWTTPPILSAFLATGGDYRAAIFQIGLLVLGVLIYLPFLKFSERMLNKRAELLTEEI